MPARQTITASEKMHVKNNFFRWLKDNFNVISLCIYIITIWLSTATFSFLTGVHITELNETQRDLKELKEKYSVVQVYYTNAQAEIKILKENMK